MAEENVFDGIILGGGHNGLILQAYLARAGLRTLTVEKNPHVGGGLWTMEDDLNPGFRHNLHAVFLRGLSAMPWFRDLELQKHGVRTVQPELNVALIQRSGRSLRWYLDLDQTCDSIAEFSKKDAESWRRIAEEYAEMVEKIVEPELASPPLPPEKRRILLGRSALGRRYLEIEPPTLRVFIERHFENPTVRALLLFLCVTRELDLQSPSQGGVIPSLIAARTKTELAVGGSRAVAQALRKAVEAAGGEIWEGHTIRAITVEQGRATGIELADGKRIKARAFVASNLNPHQTLQELVGMDKLNPLARLGLRSYLYQVVGPLFSVHLSLNEPLRGAGHIPGPRSGLPDDPRSRVTGPGLQPSRSVQARRARAAKGNLGNHPDRLRSKPSPAGQAHGLYVGKGALLPGRSG